jgi:hypothetical protein
MKLITINDSNSKIYFGTILDMIYYYDIAELFIPVLEYSQGSWNLVQNQIWEDCGGNIFEIRNNN